MEIKMLKIDQLNFATYNPRQITESQFAKLRNVIKEFGFVQPVVVNMHKGREFTIVGGHMRTRAAALEGMTEVPCFIVDLDEQKEKILNLALNRISGQWDAEKLGEVIISLNTEDAQVGLTGFEEHEVSQIMDDQALLNSQDEEEETGTRDELPPDPISKLGEIYELGPHRLICGDSTDPETYRKLLGEEKADMVFTDPPYNVDYHSRGEGLKDKGLSSIKNDAMSFVDFDKFLGDVFGSLLSFVKDGAATYFCSGWSSYPIMLKKLVENGYNHSGVIIWVKNVASMGWNNYRYKHEWVLKGKRAKKEESLKAESILYGWKEGKHRFYGEDEYDVWEMPRKPAQTYLHPTEKPDWLIMRAMRNSSKRGDIVVDPFGGSGSTMAAAEKMGRRAFLIELDPRFCDVIRERYAKMKR